MILLNKKIATLSIFIFALFISLPAAKAAVMDKVLAVVNDELITQSELDRILIPIYKQYKAIYDGEELVLKMDKTRRDVLNQMINDKLILSNARKREIKVKSEEIDKKIEELKNKFSSEDEFQQAIINQGTTLAQLQKRFEEELLKDKFVDMEVRGKIVITPTEINEYYNSNIDKFKVGPQVRLLNILVRVKEDEDRQKVYDRASEILERLKKGEDFKELAITCSDGTDATDGGDMGYVKKGQLRKELDEVVFLLGAGEFSDIVESKIGYHIFMVLHKKEEELISLEDVYDDIRVVLFRQKAEMRFEELIEKLKKDAYISIK